MLKKTIVIVALCCMTAIFAQDSEKPSLPLHVMDGSNNLLAIPSTNISTTTTKPTEIPTKTPTTTTTVKPSTKTTTIITTTSSTTVSPPNTTTPSTTTTTTPTTTTSPTTTVKPTPSPSPPTPTPTPVNPTQGKWSINNTITNKTCIMLEMAIEFDIITKDSNRSSKVHINVPSNATATGSCDDIKQSITLKWSPVVNVTDYVTFDFTKTNTSGFDLSEITAKLNVSLPGKDTQVFKLNHTKNEFVTPLSKSYKCYKEQTLNLTVEDMQDVSAVLKVSQVQVEAFHNKTGSNFSDAMDCMSSETPDVVPIAVGCALAALVIIVLIVYLMGRRRSQARGYLSM